MVVERSVVFHWVLCASLAIPLGVAAVFLFWLTSMMAKDALRSLWLKGLLRKGRCPRCHGRLKEDTVVSGILTPDSDIFGQAEWVNYTSHLACTSCDWGDDLYTGVSHEFSLGAFAALVLMLLGLLLILGLWVWSFAT